MLLTKLAPFVVVLVLGILALIVINNMVKRPLEGYAYADNDPQISLDDEIAGLLNADNLAALDSQLDPQLEKMKTEINDIVLSDPQEAARLLLTFIKE